MAGKEHIHVDAVAGIDDQAQPARRHLRFVPVRGDQQIGIVQAVNADIAPVGKINASGGGKLRCRDMVYFILPALLHILRHYLLRPYRQRLDGALIPAQQVIEDINGKFVLVFGDDDLVPTLAQVVGGRMDGALEGLDCFIFLLRPPGIGPGLILENQKEPPCNSLTGADLLHKIQVILLHQAALLVFLMGHLPAHRVQVAVDVRAAGQNLDLKLDGRDFQVRNEGVDDIPLLSGAPQHEVDRDNLDHLDKPMVLGVDNAVLHLLNGQIIRHRIEAGGLLLLDMGRAFRQAPLFRALLCFLFRLISLGRTLLFGIFLGPQLFTDLIAAHFIELSREICLARPPALRGLGLFLLGRPLFEMLACRFGGRRFFLRLRTITADNAAVPQVFQKNDQELRKALPGYADQSDQPYRKSGQAQNDDAGGQPKRKEQKNRRPDGKHQDAGLDYIPRTEHTAEKSACFYKIRRYDISIMVVFVAHVLPRFRSRGAGQPMIQKGPPAPARRLASFRMMDRSQSCSLRL